ncbi:helix-turn-helix domain-containing protein [Streptomyces sp. NPDC059629]|uniref:helix-turn-helix domain-containing protein n=1 Tax=Streptomyces sp. NPDC059629 TaxID=3346889 RepID=UPI0036CAC734
MVMPKFPTVGLTPEQQVKVRRRPAGRDPSRNQRRRLECIPLLGRGLTIPQVADPLECHPITVRDAVHRFVGGGCDALADAPRPGRPAQVTDDELGEKRLCPRLSDGYGRRPSPTTTSGAYAPEARPEPFSGLWPQFPEGAWFR